jgi:general secretion pathway protein G
MSAIRRSSSRGFTLVEILIVVIILGILAAIVIPQFTSASTEARENSTRSLLQTLRSQIELYKLQHNDNAPALENGSDWSLLTDRTNVDGTVGTDPAEFPFGPYLQQTPRNPLNSLSSILVGEFVGVAPTSGITDVGFVFCTDTGRIWATDSTGDAVFVENPAAAAEEPVTP